MLLAALYKCTAAAPAAVERCLRRVCRNSALTLLGALHLVVGVLQQFGDHRLDVLADIASLRQRGAVADRERHVQTLGDRLRQQRLAHAGGAEQQDVGLVQLHVVRLGVEDVAAVLVRPGGRRLGGAPLLPAAAARRRAVLWLVESDAQAVVLSQPRDV